MASSDAPPPTGRGPSRGLSNDILLIDLPPPVDEAWIAKMEATYPGFKIRWANRPWYPQLSAVYTDEDYEGVTMLCTVAPHAAEKIANVHFVQLASAGADKWMNHPVYLDPSVVFATSNGTHPPQIAEWVIGTWLMMNHHFLPYAAQQAEGKSHRLLHLPVTDSPGMRMGILGYGAIGRQCARLGRALGMDVYAYTRNPKLTPESRRDDSYCVPGTGDPEGLLPGKWFHGESRQSIDEFLAQDLDLLVVSLPLTKASRGVLGRGQFEILSKKKTFVANIARGEHVDTDALVDALNEGKIRGAALDVTDPEPLPDGHKLFEAKNVFITPHVSWQTPHYFERVTAIMERNLGALARMSLAEGGKDGGGMINVMDRVNHY
ncbi:hypothetical protein B0T17DRAFT_500158 [Bombardia bombarda]|uniref:D-isomer specific 2-hydroxyacid dehydrogenase NAD-binding domain-containing protein n=1 Tax=Bombardia bombarda TaxID=252184 RepID=A0AA39U441_9PEZI|nr:hypothetical protein B0T17DRAFT_500158 [Bombardia bombarda]